MGRARLAFHVPPRRRISEAGGGAVPIAERADWNLAPDCGVEASALLIAAARFELYFPERYVDAPAAALLVSSGQANGVRPQRVGARPPAANR
jgi:hypothetical protein